MISLIGGSRAAAQAPQSRRLIPASASGFCPDDGGRLRNAELQVCTATDGSQH